MSKFVIITGTGKKCSGHSYDISMDFDLFMEIPVITTSKKYHEFIKSLEEQTKLSYITIKNIFDVGSK